MKQPMGLTAALLAAMGAAIGISSLQSKAPPAPTTLQKIATTAGVGQSGTRTGETLQMNDPCSDLKEHLQTFLFLSAKREISAPDSCDPDDKPSMTTKAIDARKKKLGKKTKEFRDLRFVIATLPDPLHTHLPLEFDRYAEAIQQAAQDEGYEYDSSWLPWETEKVSYARIEDQDKADDRTAAKENQPGILLFRKQLQKRDIFQDQPYKNGLVVFIVGEEATGGIHRRQFENAVAWIEALQPRNTVAAPKYPVQILGPSFSGSIPSLIQIFEMHKIADTLRPVSDHSFLIYSDPPTSIYSDPLLSIYFGPYLQVFSGAVTSDTAVEWLNHMVEQDPALKPQHIQFRSFQNSDKSVTDLYCRYLIGEGTDPSRLAIVSEDETAFGGEFNEPAFGGEFNEPPKKDANDSCTKGTKSPGHFYYPRDISALRAAYQSQSIFSRSAAQQASDTARPTLQADLADPAGKQQDTIRSYSGDQTALSQEAELQQIVSMLRAHRSQYILLRSSNPLDELFLAHYFRLTYPEGRLVIQGSDLLLRREQGVNGLNGVMTLSTYPLLPWGQDWTKGDDSNKFYDKNRPDVHSHRAIADDGALGTYIAARFLLHQERPGFTLGIDAPEGNGAKPVNDSFLQPGHSSGLPNYAPPWWEKQTNGQVYPVPSEWLTVLGHGGFWPVAVLDDITERPCKTESPPCKRDPAPGKTEPPPRQPLRMPLSMNILLVILVFWAMFHAFCCSRPSLTVRPCHRAHFVRIRNKSNLSPILASNSLLILAGSLIVALIPILLAWGYGEMSKSGDPLRHPWIYGLILFTVWAISGFGLCANVWIEHSLPNLAAKGNASIVKMSFCKRLKESVVVAPEMYQVIRRPLGAYIGFSLGLYLLFASSLERALNDANRIPTYWRSINLASGVSPLTPLLALAVGMYGWFWYSLQGKALFGDDQPVLPRNDSLKVDQPDGKKDDLLTMLSQENAGQPIDRLCEPFSGQVWLSAAGVFIAVIFVAYGLSGGLPIRSLGAHVYSIFFSLWVALCISILLANAWQMSKIWLKLREILLYLDKLPLRRIMEALKGCSWGSLWKMGDNILDVRQKLIFRQLESLNHLRASLVEMKPPLEGTPPCARSIIEDKIEHARSARLEFARWYALYWNDRKGRDLSYVSKVQCEFADTAALVLTKLLIPRWRVERDSLVLSLGGNSDGNTISSDSGVTNRLVEALPGHIRNGEELVCLVYMAFIQKILGRIRSLAIGMIWLFVAIAIALASYPFDPQPVVSATIIVLFILLGAVIVMVYSQMHRDATLSHLTNTNPGELGGDFWLKLLGFGIGPVFGLLAAIFPAFASFFFSWLQPGVSAMK